MSSPQGPTHKQLRGVAVFVGLMIGLGMLSLMRPGTDRVPPVKREFRRAERPLVEEPAPAPRRAAPTRRLRWGRPSPAPAVEPEVEASDEPVEVGFTVRGERGEAIAAQIEPLDCPGIEFTSPSSFRAPPGPCVLRAVRQDGLLMARGEPVTLQIRPGASGTFDVPMDAPPQGGVGVQFRGTGEGMRVDRVLQGTPADRAGLEPGDLIVAVEGESVVGVDIQEFVERITGPEGTDVEFTVEYTTDTGTTQQRLLVTRERLGS